MAGKLTARKVTTAKSGKYSDGGNLYLIVSDTGARKWVLRSPGAAEPRKWVWVAQRAYPLRTPARRLRMPAAQLRWGSTPLRCASGTGVSPHLEGWLMTCRGPLRRLSE